MARFRGTLKGARGEASRLGSESSGLCLTANGWNVGVSVSAYVHEGSDRISLYLTGGSHDRSARRHLCTVGLDAEGNPTVIEEG